MPQAKPGSWWQALSSLVGRWNAKLFAVWSLKVSVVVSTSHTAGFYISEAPNFCTDSRRGNCTPWEKENSGKPKEQKDVCQGWMSWGSNALGPTCPDSGSWGWVSSKSLTTWDILRPRADQYEVSTPQTLRLQKSETFTVNALQSRLVAGKTCQGNHQMGRTRLWQIFDPKH